jgi:hypothetical protein
MVAPHCSSQACPGLGFEIATDDTLQFKGAVARTYDADLHEFAFFDCSLGRYFFPRAIRRIYTAAERAALSAGNLFTGLLVFESDTGREMLYDGTGWVIMSEPIVTYNAAALTNIAASAQSGYYQRTNGMIEFKQFITLSGAPTGLIGVTLPVALASTDEFDITAKAIDTGVNDYPLRGRMGTTSRVDLYGIQYDPTLGAVARVTEAATSGTVPVALAAGDRILVVVRGRMTTRYS